MDIPCSCVEQCIASHLCKHGCTCFVNACIECGVVNPRIVETRYGKVCMPCFDSGDTGEPVVLILDDDSMKTDNVYPWSILRRKILNVLGEGIRLTADQVSRKLGTDNSSVETMLKKMVETQDGISAILVDRGYVYFGCEYKN